MRAKSESTTIHGVIFRAVFTDQPEAQTRKDGTPMGKWVIWGAVFAQMFSRDAGRKVPGYKRQRFVVWESGDTPPPPLDRPVELECTVNIQPKRDGDGVWVDTVIQGWKEIPLPEAWRGIPLPQRPAPGGYGAHPPQQAQFRQPAPTPPPDNSPWPSHAAERSEEPPPAAPWGSYDGGQTRGW